MDDINIKDPQLVEHIQLVHTHINEVPDEDKCSLEDEKFSESYTYQRWD